MKINKMPTTMILLIFSWLTAFCGLIFGGYLIIFNFGKTSLLTRGILVLLGSLLLSTVIRMFANIGQMLFELKIFFDQIERHLGLRK